MRSFIKIYGPPVLKAIRNLEKIAVDMPEVCIMDTLISREVPASLARDIGGAPPAARISDPIYSAMAGRYYASSGISIPVERCSSIISRSEQMLGEYDFFFEWFQDPTTDQLNELVKKIDAALAPLGCRYTITTKD